MSKKQKKWLSEISDEQKTTKTAFRARPKAKKTEKIDFRASPKSKKQKKQFFGHGRKTKNGENCISATAETEKTPQNGFPTPWK